MQWRGGSLGAIGLLIGLTSTVGHPGVAGEFRAAVVESGTGQPLAARVYLQRVGGPWLFVESAAVGGSAWPYREQWVPMPGSVEQHTTVSAHPFRIELPAGEYRLEVERGKEYLPFADLFTMTAGTLERKIELTRWIDVASRGWYSGETHVHRRLSELPNVMLAEDLNVAFPVTFWTTRADRAPNLEPSTLRRQGPSPFGPREDRGAAPIWIDPTHVLLPRNTESEIFSVGNRQHVLGAVFILNHQSTLMSTAPPVRAIAEQAHAEGALLDLDKHSWPWSMMLVPVAQVDLYELSNNSVWRTQFGFKQSPVAPAEWMEIELDEAGAMTEWGWLNFGFEVYYALLNCGFRLAPTAGTASGVHPVPLGYSRVYVHTGQPFTVERWLVGLKGGRSFVTTGPMIFATVDGEQPGATFSLSARQNKQFSVDVEVHSQRPLVHIELLANGRVATRVTPALARTPAGGWQGRVRLPMTLDDTGWLAVRAVEPQPDGRKRFAHSAPWHVAMENRPAVPRREQIAYLIQCVEREVARNRGVLGQDALAEFEQALEVYRQIAQRVR